MRVLQISDLHIGLTTESSIRKMFKEASKLDFDMILNCGDNSGQRSALKPCRLIAKMMREYWLDKPILTVNSNHDSWLAGHENSKPSLADWLKQREDIKQIYKDYNIHYMDEDGIFEVWEEPNMVFVGVGGWYGNSNPPTNDSLYLPHNIEGISPHLWLRNEAEKKLDKQLLQLDKIYNEDTVVCFVSHFPVIKTMGDKGFDLFAWSERIGELMKERYDCQYFFEGHSHLEHKGPIVYNCGSDYYHPKYQIVEVY